MSTIFVTNNSDKKLVDGFAGKFYEFLPGKTVEIPIEAANHIFGYEDSNKEPYLARLGWLKNSNEIEDALKVFAKWELTTEPPKKNQSLSPLVEKVPLPSERKVGGKILQAVV
jgi:hypothetical protein